MKIRIIDEYKERIKIRREPLRFPILPKTLSEYRTGRKGFIDIRAAVSIMMPVALEIARLHKEGHMLPGLRPDTLDITDRKLTINDAAFSYDGVIFPGFSAPEVYKGIVNERATDIYSFTAILFYLIMGFPLENAYNRMTLALPAISDELFEKALNAESIYVPELKVELDPFEPERETPESVPIEADTIMEYGFAEILEKGLAVEAEDRYFDMSELIAVLEPYNTKASIIYPIFLSVNEDEIHNNLIVSRQARVRKEKVPVIPDVTEKRDEEEPEAEQKIDEATVQAEEPEEVELLQPDDLTTEEPDESERADSEVEAELSEEESEETVEIQGEPSAEPEAENFEEAIPEQEYKEEVYEEGDNISSDNSEKLPDDSAADISMEFFTGQEKTDSQQDKRTPIATYSFSVVPAVPVEEDERDEIGADEKEAQEIQNSERAGESDDTGNEIVQSFKEPDSEPDESTLEDPEVIYDISIPSIEEEHLMPVPVSSGDNKADEEIGPDESATEQTGEGVTNKEQTKESLRMDGQEKAVKAEVEIPESKKKNTLQEMWEILDKMQGNK